MSGVGGWVGRGRFGRMIATSLLVAWTATACSKRDAPASGEGEAPSPTIAAGSAAPPGDLGGAEGADGKPQKGRSERPKAGERGDPFAAATAAANAPGASIPSPPGAGGPTGAEAPAEVAIDPNGRFATTYRPGGGHLAAFESALARGIVSAGEREIVSDVGARYAPGVEAPKGKALAVKTDFERGKVGPAGGPLHMRIALRSAAEAPSRPHLSVHLVLDVSGSMAGESIQRARDASAALVDKLAPTDDFSLVTFSSDAQVLVPDGPVGARKASIKKTISEIKEGGGTNIGRGLELGYKEAHAKAIPDDAVRVVLLLSDGRANGGITSSEKLAKLALDAFQEGVQTSSFGLGADYDGDLMSKIASDGAGGYYYLRDAEQIAPALGTELDKRLDPVATAVELRVRLKKDVGLLHVYGSRRLSAAEAARVRTQEVASDQQAEKRDKIKKDREDDAQGGMRFFIPAFAHDDAHALLLKLQLPAGVGNKAVATVELKYKDRLAKKNVTEEIPIALTYGNSDAESAQSADASVARTVQGFAAGETLTEAAGRIARGDRQGATAMLAERESLLRKAAETLGEPLFLKDAERLARLRSHAGTTTGVGDPLVLAMLLETAGRVHLH